MKTKDCFEFKAATVRARVVVATQVNREKGAKTGHVYEYEFDGEAWVDEDGEEFGGIVEQYALHALWHARNELGVNA